MGATFMAGGIFAAISLIITLLLGDKFINILMRMKLGQHIREDGPSSHLGKAGVPTMGAIIFLFTFFLILSAMLVLKCVSMKQYLFYIIGVFSFASIGFYDDYKKIKKKENEGLTAKGKMLIILIITAGFYLFFLRDVSVFIPFTNRFMIENSAINFIFFMLLFAAMTNASNFSDGLDGLLASVTLVITVMFSFIAVHLNIPEIFSVNMVFGAALLGYLKFNWHPAKVFMGDFGSIAIGSYVVLNAILLDIIWFIPVFGLWYVVEVASVIIQVFYYKKTKRRFFRMAPFHHHLELGGWSEEKVVLFASGLTAVLSLVTYFSVC